MGKKFYWLKLKNDFFSQPKIKKLRKMEKGDTYAIIYLKMQLLSLQNDGQLIFEGIEEDFASEIALKLDEDEGAVGAVIQYLQTQGLLALNKNEEYYLSETQSLIGSETESAARVRKYRNNVTEEEQALHCNEDVTNGNDEVTGGNGNDEQCNTEIELRDRDKELEKEKDNISSSSNEEVEPEPLPPSLPPADEPSVERVNYKAIQEQFNTICKSFPKVQTLSDARKKTIKARISNHGLDTLEKVFRMAEDSKFLKGDNKDNWQATFDWIMTESNFIKILEGNYVNKKPHLKRPGEGGNKTDYSQIYKKQNNREGCSNGR